MAAYSVTSLPTRAMAGNIQDTSTVSLDDLTRLRKLHPLSSTSTRTSRRLATCEQISVQTIVQTIVQQISIELEQL